jgi:hypothetical protein
LQFASDSLKSPVHCRQPIHNQLTISFFILFILLSVNSNSQFLFWQFVLWPFACGSASLSYSLNEIPIHNSQTAIPKKKENNLQLLICLGKASTLANSTWLCLSKFTIQPQTEASLPSNFTIHNICKSNFTIIKLKIHNTVTDSQIQIHNYSFENSNHRLKHLKKPSFLSLHLFLKKTNNIEYSVH